MTPELIKYLLSWAVFYSGYQMPAEMPVIEYVPHSYFVETICYNVDTAAEPCAVRAMYDDNKDGIIFVDAKYIGSTTPYLRGIIVHEMVHYLQDMSGEWEGMEDWSPAIICEERSYRQREAYMVQDKYNEDIHGVKRSMQRRFGRCGM